jgi:protein-S-isoprenylcysteine O-methyltransferase Ste14
MGPFYWVWILLWVLFYAIHSALATQRVKEWTRRHINSLYKHYRIVYNLIHLAAFVGIWMYGSFFPSFYVMSTSRLILIVAAGLLAWGGVAGFAAFRSFDGGEFLLGRQTRESAQLIESGWYGRVRHPLYFALLLLLFGGLLIWPTAKMALFVLVTCVYLPFGMYWEEKKLLQAFGSKYREYMSRTPQIIPYLWK